jgi:NADH dehydrogenase
MAGTITVFGGTGFIGRHLVALLLRSGKTVRMAVRHPGRVKTPAEGTNAPDIVQADMLDDASVGSAIMGADAVFNLVGILTETSTQTYRAIHVEGARRVALAAQNHRAMRLIHISALGASPTSPAISDRTKAEGEEAVRAAFPQATIVRPSLVFGEDDHFFSRFAAMIRSSPVLPLIGAGTTRFQPLFVDDMTAGLLKLLSRQSRNQTGGRRQNSSSAVRAILDDPPIHIRPVCSRKRGCEGQEPCGFNAFQHAHGCTPPPPRPQDSSHVLSRVSS